jgi:hypothetical protein
MPCARRSSGRDGATLHRSHEGVAIERTPRSFYYRVAANHMPFTAR